MRTTAIFYGPENGSVHRVAGLIRDLIGPEKIELVPVKNASSKDLDRFDKIIFGISTVGKETWDGNPAGGDWGKFLPEIGKAGFEGKKVAIYGLGDHITYPSNFVDSMGLLARELERAGVTLSGQVPAEGYEFEESAALKGEMFVGLPLDEDFQPELTLQRVREWLDQLENDFIF